MSFNVSEEKEWVSQYKKIWNEVESQLFEKMATEPIKKEGRYVNGKLKTWKEHIKTNFHGQDVPYNMYCNVFFFLLQYLVEFSGRDISILHCLGNDICYAI